MAGWFIMIRDEVRGPLSSDQLRNAALKGLVKRSTNVRKGEDGDWFRAEQIKGLIPNQATSPPILETAPPQPSQPVTAESPVQQNVPSTQPADDFDPAAVAVKATPKRRVNRRRSSPIPVLVLAICGIGLLMGLLYFLSQR
ncbi:MAG: DUF4339 domain-containing protein [Planctomycetaceae bacterium]